MAEGIGRFDVDGELLVQASSVIEESVPKGVIDSAYLSGSLAAGLGNNASDVDIFVLLRDDVKADMDAIQILKYGKRFDIEFHRTGVICEMVRGLTSWTASPDDPSALRSAPSHIDLLVRLYYAKSIIQSASLQACQNELETNEARIRQLLISWWSFKAACLYEDFDGACTDRDPDLAGVTGRSLVTCAGKAIAAGAGDLYLGEKWVYRQLSRSLRASYPHQEFRDYMNAAWTSDFDLGKENLIRLVQVTLIAAQTLGWIYPNVNLWPDWQASREYPKCKTSLIPVRFTDGIVLHCERKEQYLVSPEYALLWALADGRDENSYMKLAMLSSALSPEFSELDESLCLQARRELIATGVMIEA